MQASRLFFQQEDHVAVPDFYESYAPLFGLVPHSSPGFWEQEVRQRKQRARERKQSAPVTDVIRSIAKVSKVRAPQK